MTSGSNSTAFKAQEGDVKTNAGSKESNTAKPLARNPFWFFNPNSFQKAAVPAKSAADTDTPETEQPFVDSASP